MKPLPYKYYKEVCGELARSYWDARHMPQRQQARIDAVIESGLDYEIMLLSNGNSWEIPLSKLIGFLEDAKAVNVDKMKEVYNTFKSSHIGIKGLVGDLRAAKIEAELKKLKYPNYTDEHHYNLYGQLCERYKLDNKQAEKLMVYFMKIEIL